MPNVRLCLLASLLLLCAPTTARSEPQNGGAAVSLFHAGIRVPYAIAPQPDSGALVVNLDTRNGVTEAYAQRLDRHGVPLLGLGGSLVWTGIGNTQLSGLAPDGSGGVVLVWTQYSATTGTDIYVQRILPSGAIAYAPGGLLVCNAPFDQVYPQIAAGAAGFYYIAWTDNRANVASQADIYVQRFSLAGAPSFAANGLLVNALAYRSSGGSVNCVPDLSGGVLLDWSVNSSGGIRAQRLSSAGALLFTANGMPLGDPSDYYGPIAPDGSGGLWAFTTRYSSSYYTPYAHHLTSTGLSSFPPTGIAFHSALDGYFSLSLVRNASGGCFFIGTYYYNSSSTITYTLFRQEVSGAGALLRGPDGELLANNSNLYTLIDAGSSVLLATFDDDLGLGTRYLRLQRFAYDGTASYPGIGVLIGRSRPTANSTVITMGASATGVVMEAHADGRYITPTLPYNYQGFGQAFDATGNPLWDDAENPVIASAQDAPGDQGGLVRVAWTPGVGDMPTSGAVQGYRGWRALGVAAAARIAPMHAAAPDQPFRSGAGQYVVHAGLYWERVTDAPAAELSAYAVTLPTGQDSTGGAAADESFMIEAYDDSLHHWWSAVKTAHSVDNVAPATPTPFTGQYVSGNAYLYWNPNTEADLYGYRLYRGGSVAFVPGPANLVAAMPDPGWIDPAGGPAVYKLSAVDIHGNESHFAMLVPNGTLAVDDARPKALAFSMESANPAHGGATMRLALPAPARVRGSIYDAAGRRLRTLLDAEQPAGFAAIGWNGEGEDGRAAPSGLYFARLETAGRALTLRLAFTR